MPMCSRRAHESVCTTTSTCGSGVDANRHDCPKRPMTTGGRRGCIQTVELTAADVAELAGVLPLAIELEPYRERMRPLAIAVLQGESPRTIDKRRDLVLADVWDDRLRQGAREGIDRLEAELERKRGVLALVRADLENPARKSKLARQLVDRVLTGLLESNEQNIAALEELERELEALPSADRAARAAAAARGAYVVAAIPPNELRAAMVRAARAVERHGIDNHDSFDRAAILLAATLATDRRRAAVRGWVGMLADSSAEHVPILAAELHALAAESAVTGPTSDLIWIQACLGLALEMGMAMS